MIPQVSIIIPAFNVEAYIVSTLESVWNQTFKDYELIIINDASSDRTEEVVLNYIDTHKFQYTPFYLKNAVNHGCCSSRNVGIHIARGKYVCFLDADDIYREDFLLCLYNEIVHTGSDFVFCGYDTNNILKGTNQKFTDKRNYPICHRKFHIIYNYMIGATHIGHWAAMYNLNFIRSNQIFYFDGCQKAGDTEFVLDVLLCCKKLSFVPKSLYVYNIRPNSITTSEPSIRLFDGYFAYKRVFNKIRNPFIKILYYFTKYPRETHLILQAFYIKNRPIPYLYTSKYKILWFCFLNLCINKQKDSKTILIWFWNTQIKIK